MSRCFPYPPPGYEVRQRSEPRKDLLKKERHKEKKHRKEKESGKGERKEKDRDHRKGRHSKKHKREKHAERRKNKDIDKDKNQTLGQETLKNYDHGNKTPEGKGQNEAVKAIKPTDEFAARIFCEEGRTEHKCNDTRELLLQSADSIVATDSKEKERNSLSGTVRKSTQATQDNHGVVQQSDSIACADKKGMGRGVDFKTETKNGKSLQVGSSDMRSRRKQSYNGVNVWKDNSDTQRNSRGVHTASSIVSGSGREANGRITTSTKMLQRAEEMGQDPEISVHNSKGKSDRINSKRMKGKENRSVNNCRGKMDQQFVRNKDGAVKGNGNTKDVKINNRKCVKCKDSDRIVKKRKTQYKNKEKVLEKNGAVNEQKHESLGPFGASKDQVAKTISDDIKKRKYFDANSSPSDHGMRTTKLPRISPTNITCADEGICWPAQGITPYVSAELAGPNSCKIDRHKPQDSYNNDVTGSHHSEEHIALISSPGYDNKDYQKQPHPDTKYLRRVLSIPSTQEFPEHIDQDWLFTEDRAERKTATFEASKSCQVWSDAQLIDITGVIALPYVVPL